MAGNLACMHTAYCQRRCQGLLGGLRLFYPNWSKVCCSHGSVPPCSMVSGEGRFLQISIKLSCNFTKSDRLTWLLWRIDVTRRICNQKKKMGVCLHVKQRKTARKTSKSSSSNSSPLALCQTLDTFGKATLLLLLLPFKVQGESRCRLLLLRIVRQQFWPARRFVCQRNIEMTWLLTSWGGSDHQLHPCDRCGHVQAKQQKRTYALSRRMWQRNCCTDLFMAT